MNTHIGTEGARERGSGERLLELDVLRGLAALAVVLFHYTVRFSELYPTYPASPFKVSLGAFAVEYFFCISGFVIFMTLERTRQPMDFVVSRVSRLWPAFLVAMACTFFVVHLAGLPGREVSFRDALLDATMMGELLHAHLVDSAYWSLQVELIFYFWMFIAYGLGFLRRPLLLMSLALIPPALFAMARLLINRDLSFLAGTVLLSQYAPYFVIGMASYRIREAGRIALPESLLAGVAILMCGLCYSWPQALVAGIGFFTLTNAGLGRMPWLRHSLLVFFGAISYSLYLVHQNIGYVIMRAAHNYGLTTSLGLALAFFASVGLAATITYTVERPALRAIRTAYRRHQMRRAATS